MANDINIITTLFVEASHKEEKAYASYYTAKKFGKKVEAETLRQEWKIAEAEAAAILRVIKAIN